jgi:uncharacterized protein (TIGR00730 family)
MCGRETGTDPAYIKAAHDLGQLCAENGIIGYFGGSQFGMMGNFAAGVVGHGGKVVGIMPKFLREVEKPLDSIETIWVDDFGERLERFRDPECVDVIVNGPGGVGTDAEHRDFATRDKHDKLCIPNILLNIAGIFDFCILDLRHRTEKGFMWEKPAKRLFVANAVSEILPMTRAFYAGEPVQNIFTAPLSVAPDLVRQAG